jgi:signal transduction histidine kinase
MAALPGSLDSIGAPVDPIKYSTRLIRIRWWMGSAVLAATLFTTYVLSIPLPKSLYLAGLCILAYNTGLAWASSYLGRHSTRLFIGAQFAFDWLALAAFVHLTGGIESPAIWFFLFHVLLAPLLMRGRAAVTFDILVILAVAGIAGLEAAGWLPHYQVLVILPMDLYRRPLFIAEQLAFFSITVVGSMALMMPIVREMSEHERQMAALLQDIQVFSRSLDLPRVLDALARGISLALQAKGASIRLLDETGLQLEIAAAYGLSQKYLEKGPVQTERSLIDQEALKGRPVIVEQVLQDKRLQYPAEIEAEGIRSILCVPLMGRRGPLGVVRVYSARPRFFTRANIPFATAIARQGATAVENALAFGALRRTDKDKSQFTRSVTHELRSPVAGAQSLLRSMMHNLAGNLSRAQRDAFGRLSEELDYLQMLINDLLDLASARMEGADAKSVPVAVEAVVLSVKDRLARQAEDKKIDLRVDYVPGGLTVMGSEEGLGRIFVNLLGNAIKYTPPGGHVNVALEPKSDQAMITVADTGLGIPEADMPHLFEEFFRGSNVKEAGILGSGLGLVIVKEIVERYGGRLSVQSKVGQGTTFAVALPLVA